MCTTCALWHFNLGRSQVCNCLLNAYSYKENLAMPCDMLIMGVTSSHTSVHDYVSALLLSDGMSLIHVSMLCHMCSPLVNVVDECHDRCCMGSICIPMCTLFCLMGGTLNEQWRKTNAAPLHNMHIVTCVYVSVCSTLMMTMIMTDARWIIWWIACSAHVSDWSNMQFCMLTLWSICSAPVQFTVKFKVCM
jgi:hypothetical protein